MRRTSGSLPPGALRSARRRSLRKAKGKVGEDDMHAEYDFSGAVRGKYYERYKASTNVVVLDPDVCEVFPNAVDESLPRGVKDLLEGFDVVTVPERGWQSKKNGELLRLADQEFDVFLPADQNLEHQQNPPVSAPLVWHAAVAADLVVRRTWRVR